MGTIEHESRLTLDALAIDNIVTLVANTDLAIPLRIRRATVSNSNTAFSSIVPSVTVPTVPTVCAFTAVPCHCGRAGGAQSWLEFEESFITKALNSIKFTVEGAVGNGNHNFITFLG